MFHPSLPSKITRFELGRIYITQGATALLARAGVSHFSLLARHVKGDWGDVSTYEATSNELALLLGLGVTSVYTLQVQYPDSTRTVAETIWIVTDADRGVTTFRLPEVN